MKVIEGTPQEIKEYLNKNKEGEILPKSVRDKKAFNQFLWRDQTKKYGRHWSNNKLEWVKIEKMNSAYILNVVRQRLKNNSNQNLLEDEEFQSLVINLADKIVEGD